MLVDFCVRFLLLGAFALVPGVAVLVAIRFRFASVIDALIACAVIGIGWTSACVYVLLSFDVYTPLTAALVLLVPSAWLIGVLIRRRDRFDTIRIASDSGDRLSILDRLVVACVVAFLISVFIDSATSPVTAWDGDVTWDKWATDWARRQNLYGYLLGGYPQLLPMFSSVLYKLTGAYRLIIPLDQYVLHATHVVFAFVLLGAIVRLCRALMLPAWPTIVLTFGHPGFRSAITSGSADLLLVTFTVSTIALLLTFLRGKWDSPLGVASVVAPALFGACYSKANGMLVLLYPLSYYVLQRVWLPSDAGLRRLSRKSVVAMVLLPVLATAPFYIGQVLQDQRAQHANLNPHEVNFRAITMLPTLQQIAERSSGERGIETKLNEILRRFGIRAELSAAWLIAPGICVMAVLLVLLRRRLALPLAFPAMTVAAIWYWVTSYDLRNLLPVLPIAGVLATAGAVECRAIFGRRRLSLSVAGAFSVLLAVVSGGVFLSRATAAATTMFRPDPSAPLQTVMARRIAVMQGAADDRIRMFFPSEWPTYSWVKSLRPSASAENIIATAHMYRWFAAGSYPASLWDPSWVRPGDIFVGSEPWRPPFDDQWTLLRDADGFKVWIFDVNPRMVPLAELLLAGATPPSLVASTLEAITLSLNGAQGFIGQNIIDRDLRAGSSIVWQAVVDVRDMTPAVRPGFVVHDEAIVDPQRSGVAVDVLPGDQQLVAFSGILTLSGNVLSSPPSDGIMVGIATEASNATLRLRRFRVAIYK